MRFDMPSGFNKYISPGGEATLRWEKGIAHSGERSLYISNTGTQTAMWKVADSIPCLEGVKYKISVWVRTKNASGFVGIGIRYFDKKNQWRTGPIRGKENATGTKQWHQLSFEGEAPYGATSFIVFLMSTEGKGGEVWFDDLSVEDSVDTLIGKEAPVISRQLRDVLQSEYPAGTEPGLDRSAIGQWRERAESLHKHLIDFPVDRLPTMKQRAEMASQWALLRDYSRTVKRELGLKKLKRQWNAISKQKDSHYFIGWQDTMTRIWIRDLPIRCKVKKTAYLEAVKGGTESVQLVIGANNAPLKDVRVSSSDLLSTKDRIPASQIDIHPVGFVRINRPVISETYPLEQKYYRGWWPDILLDNFAFDVAQGDTQPVFISVNLPRGIKAGTYKGTIFVQPANAPSYRLGLNLNVRDVELPTQWHFKNIMSFHDQWARNLYGDRWTSEMRAKFIDFLLARRINLASMYGDTEFTWEEIMKGVGAGQNTILLYTIPNYAGLNKASSKPPWIADKVLSDAQKTLDEWVPKLREKGLLDISLFYGFDEVNSEWFDAARNVFLKIKEDYPGLHTISTLQDGSYGMNTNLAGIVDNFMPLMEEYDAGQADKARIKGTKVWWYETSWNIEQPLLRSRLIPWMTYTKKADGFLIWCINRWVGGDKHNRSVSEGRTNSKPVENKIFSEWDPWLDGVAPNSSANYVYPGVNGPLSSLRLENFVKGIEDYELLRMTDKMTMYKKNKPLSGVSPESIKSLIKKRKEILNRLAERAL